MQAQTMAAPLMPFEFQTAAATVLVETGMAESLDSMRVAVSSPR